MMQIAQNYSVGQRVVGTVEQLLSYGIYMTLDDGTRGYIRRRELSWLSDIEPQSLLHESQRIEAVVLESPYGARRLELSLRATQPDPWQGFLCNCRVGNVVSGIVKQLRPYGAFIEILPGISGLVPLAELALWDADRAEDVLWSGDVVEAIVTRVDGRLRRLGLSIRLRAEQLAAAADAPPARSACAPLIAALVATPPSAPKSAPYVIDVPGAFQECTLTARSAPLDERLGSGLEQLLETTRAEAGIVFRQDPTSQVIQIFAQAGSATLASQAIYSLEDSPVKDVIREGYSVFERRISSSPHLQRRFRKLLDLLPFESCIGTPIQTEGAISHALFLFHGSQEAFSHYRLRDAMAAATRFAAALERAAFDQHIQSVGTFLLSGQLAAAFGHEVSNEMSGLEIQLHNLQRDFCDLAQHGEPFWRSSEYQELQCALDTIQEAAGTLRGTMALFHRLTQADTDTQMEVNDCLHTAAALLSPIANKHRVHITLVLAPDLPTAQGSTSRLQQVLLNIMLNAVQHIALTPQVCASLEVQSIYEPTDCKYPIKLRFTDQGPGIHRQLWEKIFELGFSTRPSGSGLGLFIARSLVESLGGRICVERSVVPISTTFLVELRAAAG